MNSQQSQMAINLILVISKNKSQMPMLLSAKNFLKKIKKQARRKNIA